MRSSSPRDVDESAFAFAGTRRYAVRVLTLAHTLCGVPLALPALYPPPIGSLAPPPLKGKVLHPAVDAMRAARPETVRRCSGTCACRTAA